MRVVLLLSFFFLHSLDLNLTVIETARVSAFRDPCKKSATHQKETIEDPNTSSNRILLRMLNFISMAIHTGIFGCGFYFWNKAKS